ncbi:hypothetical protein AGDE_02114 [Angomonas deanei]|uniref:Thioesterase domain-containing protein n=1 Tax=Angomonas deanei TaxID=59799 RepID=S9VLR3_9TRYP|nr:hypothetical protein AGDE_09861 [Angomonas deanei]EPY38424.1 hypothetical protein AGDE_05505 [Angomonas deanei]EPY39655.1 hypothetical protein AGDE_04273 [Angomonas deanei]EPY41809.1 hypothetical protein AGDE_02114 [Angomonas deanei]CAD2213315.1 hypothetical protein, conserved [Angomonas deanei]|eukprot:EPY29750.1 hypothetical protein AGDE_09861 [Angomonas deanei]
MQSTATRASVAQAASTAGEMLKAKTGYSVNLLNIVKFTPESIKEPTPGVLAFPWSGTEGSLNGFKSVHGGSLSTLGDVFTKIHVKAALPESKVQSVSFEISFLSAVFAGKDCTCFTRLVSKQGNLVFTDFSFEDETSGEIHARGTHVLSVV